MKKVIYLAIIIMLVVVYMGVLYWNDKLDEKGQEPTIEAPATVLEISVKDPKEKLLSDVKAEDLEDGDLTSQVFIESISGFDNENRRTVTYAVFDSDDHLVRSTRQIKYIDYEPPVIDIKKALCYYYLSDTNQYKDFVSAYSVVDGDLSAHISIDNQSVEGNVEYIQYSVKDSCGVRTLLTLKADILNNEPNIDINLTDYLLKVKKGTMINPRNYISDVHEMKIEDDRLKNQIDIQSNYNPNEEGMYEFIYRIQRSNGSFGMTKLVVIVE